MAAAEALARRMGKCGVAGILWASIGWTRGVTLGGYAVLACGGMLTLLLVAPLVEGAWRRAEDRLAPVVAALGAGLLFPLAYGLWAATHHRPLAAVTFAVMACGGLVASWLLVRRLAWSRRIPRGWSVGALVALLAAACASLSVSSLVEVGGGLVALALVFRPWPPAIEPARLAWPTAAAMFLGSTWVFLDPALHDEGLRAAPVVLGMLGIF